MGQKDVFLSIQELKPGTENLVRDHFSFDAREREALRSQLQEEGIHIESVFVHETEESSFLYSYIKAEDWHRMYNEWKGSDDEAATAFKQFLDEVLVGGWKAFHRENVESVFHIEAPLQKETKK